MGIVQFSELKKPRLLERLWCVPFYLSFILLCWHYNTHPHPDVVIIEVIEIICNLENIVCMITTCFYFYRRNNTLQSVLIKIDKIRSDHDTTFTNRSKRILLISLLALIFAFAPFMDTPPIFLIYIYFPITVNCFDLLFLSDIMTSIYAKFKLINRKFELQAYSTCKIIKLKILQQEVANSEIQLMNELSYLHSSLVQIAITVCQNFTITILVSLVLWFQNVITTIYYVLYQSIHDIDFNLDHVGNLIFLLYSFGWLFSLMEIFTGVEAEASKACTLVHSAWHKYSAEAKINPKIRHLQLISVRLLSTKLRFSARGFFDLDWKFFHLVVSELGGRKN